MPCTTVQIEPPEDEKSGDENPNNGVSIGDDPVKWAKQNPIKAGAGAMVAMNLLGK